MRAGSLLFLPFFAAVSNGLVFTLPSTSLTAGAITLTYASEASDPAGELSIWLGPVGSNTRSFAAAAKVAATKVGETGTIKVDVSAEAADGDKWEFAAGPASTRPTGLFAKSDPFTVTVAGAGAVDNAANSASASASAQQSQSASASASASSARPSLSTPSAPPSQSSASAPASASSPASALPTNSETSAPPATETTAPPPPDANAALPSSPSSVDNSASPSTSPSSNPKTGSALGASAKSPAQPVGTIVGAIIGGLVGILLIILLLVVYLRKRAWRNRLEEDLEKYASDRNGNMFAPTANEYGGEKDREGAEGLNRAPSLGYGQGAAHAQMQNPYPYTTYGSGYAGGYNA